MKKFWACFLMFFLFLLDMNAQPLNGLGTFASPYNGIFQNDLQWNLTNFPGGKVYINGDVTIDDELLSIGAGISVIFISEGADLIINGTGRINASGTGINPILFTADDDNDGNYGESNERWGHLVFNDPSSLNQSSLDYCTIEYGDVRTGSNTTSYGGALYSNKYGNLILDHCTIRNNRATHGGALLFYDGASPHLSNCLITGNTATTTGGAIYSLAKNGLSLTNCIITFNAATASSGGGIFIDGSDNSRVINCDILMNSSPSGGRNVQLYSVSSTTIRPRFINSIVWDADNSIEYSGFSIVRSTDFVNCGIRDVSTPASTFTNCIDLSATNNAATGPNFEATDGSNWSIRYVSPCRDAGVGSYPGVTIPLLDYIGNSRVLTTDIGAYEMRYSRWKTTASSTDWSTASNWDGGVPVSSTSDVIIPTGASTYPTSSPGPSFTIGSGKQLIMEPEAKLTLASLTNNGGTLRMQASSSGLSSLIMDTYTRGTGAAEDIQIYLTGGYIGDPEDGSGRWHYISSPVDGLSRTVFTVNTLDLATYVDGIQGESIRNGWVAYDGWAYLYDTDPYANPSTWAGYPYRFDNLDIGRGYNFWDNLASYTYSLSGQINTGDITTTLNFAGDAGLNGFNLLGNPFTSGLDWDYILESTEHPFPANTSQGIYFTRDDVQYSYVSGVLVPDDGLPAPSGVVPPMQGFFVKAYEDGPQIVLVAAAKTHDNIPSRYKGSSTIPLVRLSITDNGTSDETVVRLAETAKPEVDLKYDALKMFISQAKTSIYTTNTGSKFSINGQPFPETFVDIPLIVNVTASGNHTISTRRIQGLDNYSVTLTDNSTGFVANLKTTPDLTFSSSAGLISNRFVIRITNLLTGTEEPAASKNVFNIYQGFDKINIQTLSDDWDGKTGSVKILDIAGKIVSTQQNTEFYKNSVIQLQSPAAKGLYVVELSSGAGRYVGKVIVK